MARRTRMGRKIPVTRTGPVELRSRLSELMIATDTTWDELEAIGLNKTNTNRAINRIGSCTLSMLNRYADALGVTLGELYEEVPVQGASRGAQTAKDRAGEA